MPTKNSQPVISVRNLSMTYPNGVQALKGISFDVAHGEFLVVIGLSGSGKSTLLRCLNRLLEPTSGEVIFQGDNVTHVRGAQVLGLRKNVAMIFQHFNLIPRHSVLNNVLMGRLAHTSTLRSLIGQFSSSDRAEAQRFLNLVGIGEKAQMRADNLSGGQQQRVAIARALAQNPKVLLADEPVASLDPATCHTVMDYLKNVNRELGITVICNLHFLSLVRQYASRVIALKAGELVYNGSPTQIDSHWFERIYGEAARDIEVR